jgi:hypothetical protein
MMKSQNLKIAAVLGIVIVSFALIGHASPSYASAPVRVDILYMNHGPMQPTLRALKALFQRYAGKAQVSWYDFDAASGKAFMKKKGINAHIPLLIYLNGAYTVRVGNQNVSFMGFPTGAGPYQFQGKWSLNDLESVLHALAR